MRRGASRATRRGCGPCGYQPLAAGFPARTAPSRTGSPTLHGPASGAPCAWPCGGTSGAAPPATRGPAPRTRATQSTLALHLRRLLMLDAHLLPNGNGMGAVSRGRARPGTRFSWPRSPGRPRRAPGGPPGPGRTQQLDVVGQALVPPAIQAGSLRRDAHLDLKYLSVLGPRRHELTDTSARRP